MSSLTDDFVHVEPVQDIALAASTLEPALQHLGDALLFSQPEIMIRLRNLCNVMLLASRAIQSGVEVDNERLKSVVGEFRKALGMTDMSMLMMPSNERLQAMSLKREGIISLMEGFDNLLHQMERSMASGAKSSIKGVAAKSTLADQMKPKDKKGTTAAQFALEGLSDLRTRIGRKAGDELFRQAAGLIKGVFADKAQLIEDDNGFVVVMDTELEESALKAASEQVIHAIENLHRMLTVAAGIVVNETSEDALRKLDLATREARAAGGGVASFTPELAVKADKSERERLLALEILKDGPRQIYPVFQRIFPTAMAKKLGKRPKYEALVRVRRDDITTFRFLNVMRDEGRLSELTRLMIPMSMAAVKGRNVDLALNITPEELGQTINKLPYDKYIQVMSAKFGFPLSNLIVELVEWSDEDELCEAGLEVLSRLTKMGCKVALDDYGVKGSNLVRLMQLCANGMVPDFLKIDAALVKHLNKHVHARDAATLYAETGIRSIVATTRELSEKSGKPVCTVAEFVDNSKVQKALEKMGVHFLQGFYLAKPKEAPGAFS